MRLPEGALGASAQAVCKGGVNTSVNAIPYLEGLVWACGQHTGARTSRPPQRSAAETGLTLFCCAMLARVAQLALPVPATACLATG